MTLWHGRFEDGPAEEMMRFTVDRSIDLPIAIDDVIGSKAHVRGLVKAGILTAEEGSTVGAALDHVLDEIADGTFKFLESDEDIHSAVERRVTEIAGAAGAKLHTGRSRNDQVITDVRLYTKRKITDIVGAVIGFQRVLLARAEQAGEKYLPGYTHMQRAQAVLLAHHLLAHGWALSRDVDRLLDARSRVDVSPLGAGALAGSSLPLDPEYTAKELGFEKVFDNSMDAVSDRDFIAETLFCLSLLHVHLSRMGEEIVLWSTEEFGFAKLPDSHSTGSSMLPQKKNADIAELARGKAGRVVGELAGLLTTLKGLPLAFNRDLQEDKRPLFDAIEQSELALAAMRGLYEHVTFNTDRMQQAADLPILAATDLAETLVEKGTPFREAHAIVGDLVRQSVERHVPLAELVEAHPDLGKDALLLLEAGAAVLRRTTRGGAGPEPVAEQMVAFRRQLEADYARMATSRDT